MNTYLGLEDVEPKEYLAKLAEKEEVRLWLPEILEPRPTSSWIGIRVTILHQTLSFKAKKRQIFVCTRPYPCMNENSLPLAREVQVAFIMVGYQSIWML